MKMIWSFKIPCILEEGKRGEAGQEGRGGGLCGTKIQPFHFPRLFSSVDNRRASLLERHRLLAARHSPLKYLPPSIINQPVRPFYSAAVIQGRRRMETCMLSLQKYVSLYVPLPLGLEQGQLASPLPLGSWNRRVW